MFGDSAASIKSGDPMTTWVRPGKNTVRVA